MSKHVSSEENAIALSWRRRNYIHELWGKDIEPCPVRVEADIRSFEFLELAYADAESDIDQLLPTNRFHDDLLWVVAAIKWHMLAEWKFTQSDHPGWHMTRKNIKRVITEGHIKVLGASNAPALRKIDKLITEFYELTDPTGWVERKPGFGAPGGRGVATYMLPSESFLIEGLSSLPVVRDDSPLLVVPNLQPPRSTASGERLPVSTVGVSATGGGEWIDLRSVVALTTPSAAWSYDNKNGRKSAVLWALKQAGVDVLDRPNGNSWDQRLTNPSTGKEYIITRVFKDRWIRLPSGMSIPQLVHLIEGKL